ncbi:flagellar biosynthesis protein FlhB [Thermanaerosceptrum fracticalcis]|uniref:Flagellar biosynthesis protein FlhB n=1 Tax=Thermanaerosceptrum fracticalcis TaxID=1712410 RepID=A0A7G6E153_THEFR|nr:EscU/YscU/HrcU family type III secretion system export apparatus switch protein [Thermanaerosceptrum fracticalcis]QNB45807.1 flagellar biosynthesis protein FlhB [Thermanaerosceptrum fracticalcis]
MKGKKQAAALDYNLEEPQGAPKVIAVGEGLMAEKILSVARDHGIPILENREIVAKLIEVPLGTEIPPDLYEAVARVLAFLYRLDQEKNSKNREES